MVVLSSTWTLDEKYTLCKEHILQHALNWSYACLLQEKQRATRIEGFKSILNTQPKNPSALFSKLNSFKRERIETPNRSSRLGQVTEDDISCQWTKPETVSNSRLKSYKNET